MLIIRMVQTDADMQMTDVTFVAADATRPLPEHDGSTYLVVVLLVQK
jgi:hypothetical protein